MATKYELPEEGDGKLLESLGREVEMKTFRTNIAFKPSVTGGEAMVKIICVGVCRGLHWRTSHQKDVYRRLSANEASREAGLSTNHWCGFCLKSNTKMANQGSTRTNHLQATILGNCRARTILKNGEGVL